MAESTGLLAQLAAEPSRWPYQPRPGDTCRVEPCVPVVFTGPRDYARTLALVDSGADRTMLPVEWAPKLGVELEPNAEGVLRVGVHGSEIVECFRPADPITAEVAGRVFRLDALFGNVWEPILGRSDLFRQFVVTFDERNRRTILRPYPEG